MRAFMATLALTVTALSAVAAGVLAEELVIEKQPWYGAQPQSPRLEPGRTGLDFAFVPATGARGPTLALLGVARLPALYGAIYAGRIEGAVRIVAIDLRTGESYQNNAEPRELPQLTNVMNPNPEPRPDAEPVESYFNIDLRAQLRLPPHSAKYAVFLWLDETASPVRVAQLPGPVREGTVPKDTIDPAAAGIRFGRTADSPTATKGIALRSVKARVHVDLASDARQGRLNVLALDFRSRAVSWLSFSLPRRQQAFSFDPYVMGGPAPNAPGPQKTFVLVSVGETLSEVLAVEPSAP